LGGREDVYEVLKQKVEAVLGLGRGERRHVGLGPEDGLELGDNIAQELAVAADGREQLGGPARELIGALRQNMADKLAERLGERGVGHGAVELVKLARCKISSA